jgi:5-methylcytosine-specific restriction endonuclease McrA
MKIWEREGGYCHLCQGLIKVGDKWEIEHVIPLALGGADDESNMALAHKRCHASKTIEDVHRLAKAKRQRAKHIGAKRPISWSKWRKRMDGTVERKNDQR